MRFTIRLTGVLILAWAMPLGACAAKEEKTGGKGGEKAMSESAEVGITWVGQACYVLDAAGKTILMDPLPPSMGYDSRTVSPYHDKDQGAKRGKNSLFLIEAAGLRILHTGDLGHVLPDETVFTKELTGYAEGETTVVVLPYRSMGRTGVKQAGTIVY